MARKKAMPKIPIRNHPDAEQDLESLSAETRADVIVRIVRLDGRTQTELVSMLDRRTEPKVFQLEGSASGGTLRIIFAWGRACLWMIGAFVKVNDKEGERFMRRILPRAAEVAMWDEKR